MDAKLECICLMRYDNGEQTLWVVNMKMGDLLFLLVTIYFYRRLGKTGAFIAWLSSENLFCIHYNVSRGF
jgi:hypothetical protein